MKVLYGAYISSSDFPLAYASAVSNILIPFSNATLMISYKSFSYVVSSDFTKSHLDGIALYSSPKGKPLQCDPFSKEFVGQ